MRLTKHTDLSLRVIMHLAFEPGQSCTIKDIARSYNMPYNHLVKVVHELVTLGYLGSTQGRGGGVFLARPPHELNVGQIVRKMESTLDMVDCAGNNCPLLPACRLKGVLDQATRAFLQILDGYTIADLTRNKTQLLQIIRPHSTTAPPPPS